MSKLIKVYTLNTYSLLYFNYISTTCSVSTPLKSIILKTPIIIQIPLLPCSHVFIHVCVFASENQNVLLSPLKTISMIIS